MNRLVSIVAACAVLSVAGCQTLGANARCFPYPQGVRGALRTCVVIVHGWNMSHHWDDAERSQVRQYSSGRFQETLQRLSAANPNGPQFQWISLGQPGDLWIQVTVDGNPVTVDDYDEDGPGTRQTVTSDWGAVYAQGLGHKHLFNFNTRAYPYGGNPYTQGGLYDEAAGRVYAFLANGWTCN